MLGKQARGPVRQPRSVHPPPVSTRACATSSTAGDRWGHTEKMPCRLGEIHVSLVRSAACAGRRPVTVGGNHAPGAGLRLAGQRAGCHAGVTSAPALPLPPTERPARSHCARRGPEPAWPCPRQTEVAPLARRLLLPSAPPAARPVSRCPLGSAKPFCCTPLFRVDAPGCLRLIWGSFKCLITFPRSGREEPPPRAPVGTCALRGHPRAGWKDGRCV